MAVHGPGVGGGGVGSQERDLPAPPAPGALGKQRLASQPLPGYHAGPRPETPSALRDEAPCARHRAGKSASAQQLLSVTSSRGGTPSRFHAVTPRVSVTWRQDVGWVLTGREQSPPEARGARPGSGSPQHWAPGGALLGGLEARGWGPRGLTVTPRSHTERRRPEPAGLRRGRHSLVVLHVVDDVSISFRRRAGGGAAGLVLGRRPPGHLDDLRLEPRAHVGVPSVDVLVDL